MFCHLPGEDWLGVSKQLLCGCVAVSFGTGSMSMPAGFGNAAAYNLPTSFSGTFQQPFPGQPPFPQPPAYPQQPNGVCSRVDYIDVDICINNFAERQACTSHGCIYTP